MAKTTKCKVPHQWGYIFLSLLLLMVVKSGGANSEVVVRSKQAISPHGPAIADLATTKGGFEVGGELHHYQLRPALSPEKRTNGSEVAFVERSKESTMYVGILDQGQIIAYSQSLQLAFKKSSKFTHSLLFLGKLFDTNPLLKYFAVTYKERTKLVDALERAAAKWRLFRKGKAEAVEEAMASLVLKRLYTFKKSITSRKAYQLHKRQILASLREVNAGGHALDLILGYKSQPIFSWASSLWKNPLATLTNVVTAAFHDTFDGISGLGTAESKSACYSFGFRVNDIAPYTAILPGGVFGSILTSLSRAFMQVLYPAYASFRGIFALMIGVICKSGILVAVRKMFNSLTNVTRLGLRGLRSFLRKFSVYGDPVAWPIMQDLLRRKSPVLITLLFQLHAVNVEDITKKGKRVSSAINAGYAGWNYADGLWIGGVDFGRAFMDTVRTYKKRGQAFVNYCLQERQPEQVIAGTSFSDIAPSAELAADEGANPMDSGSSRSSGGLNEDDALLREAYEAIAPDAEGIEGAREHLLTACRKNKRFIKAFTKDPLAQVQKVVTQMVKVLKYDFKFFSEYVGQMMSIFYEGAYAMLNADVANIVEGELPPGTMGEQLTAAMARQRLHREALGELAMTSMPRQFFREPWFRKAGIDLANGFFETAGGLSLYYNTRQQADPELQSHRYKASFGMLQNGVASLRKSVKAIYGRFLSSRIMIARLEGHSSVKTVQQFIAQCNQQHGLRNTEVCGNVVTSEVDPEAFVKHALFAVNAPMAAPEDDIALSAPTNFGEVFANWQASSLRLSTQNRELATRASNQESMEQFLQHLRRSVLGRLYFSRFDFDDNYEKLVLYDANGRSIKFTPDDPEAVRALSGHETGTGSHFRANPLNTRCWFHVDQGSRGTLQFPISRAAAEGESLMFATGPAAPAERMPVHKIPGQITYRDSREELTKITNDPSAVRDVIVARFVDTQGRASAEMMARLLFLIHSKSPSFARHSPSVFLQNVYPKMFFDGILALTAPQATKQATSIMLEGRLYTFPLSFSTLKSLFLGSVNRFIERMHTLDSKDMVSVFVVTLAVMAYRKIQKHRTGKTLVMNLYLRDVLHIWRAAQGNALDDVAPECDWIRQNEVNQEDMIIKCSALRFLKLGSLDIPADQKVKVRRYLDAFVGVLNNVRGGTSWENFLNIRIFEPEADLYEQTAAKYSYEELQQQLSSETDLLTDIHQGLGGPMPSVQDRGNLVTALRSYAEDIRRLPSSLRKSLKVFVNSCHGKLRRFIGAKQFKMFQSVRPNVLHASTFYSAIQGAESEVFPDPFLPRGIFIDYFDLVEYGQLQLAFEELAITLSDKKSMQMVATELRSIPLQTEEAKEEYMELSRRVKALPLATVETAAGWSIRHMGEMRGGMEIAIGMLAIKSEDPEKLTKALHLSLATVETLRFLNTSLDVAHVLEFLGRATPADLARIRMQEGSFRATVFTEARTIGLDTNKTFSVDQGFENVALALERVGLPREASILEECRMLLSNERYLSNGSFVSRHMDEVLADSAILCFFVQEFASLRDNTNTFSPKTIIAETPMDGKTIQSILEEVSNTSLPLEVRTASAGRLNAFFRGLLTACSGHLLGSVEGAQFSAVDSKTGMLTYLFTSRVDISTTLGSSTLPPAEFFRKVARVAFGVDGADALPENSKIAGAKLAYPDSLEEWYEHVDPVKLRELCDDSRQNGTELTGEVLANISASNRFVDIADYFFSLRQSSPVSPDKMISAAKQSVMESDLPQLQRVGMMTLMSDLQNLSKQTKIECLKNAMENIDVYLPQSLEGRELYKHRCFVNKLLEGLAVPSVAKNMEEEFISRTLATIDTAFEAEAQKLFNSLKSDQKALSKAQERGTLFVKHVPILVFGYVVAREVIWAILSQQEWSDLLNNLKRLQRDEWVLDNPTSSKIPTLDSVARPKLFNPLQLASDCLFFMLTGRYERRRLPKALIFKRAASSAKRMWGQVKENAPDSMIREARAQELVEEIRRKMQRPDMDWGSEETDVGPSSESGESQQAGPSNARALSQQSLSLSDAGTSSEKSSDTGS